MKKIVLLLAVLLFGAGSMMAQQDKSAEKAAKQAEKEAKKAEKAAKKAADKSFKVKTKQALNIYKSPGKDYTGKKAPESVYTITETKTVEKIPYGKLKSGEGWIKIAGKYAETL